MPSQAGSHTCQSGESELTASRVILQGWYKSTNFLRANYAKSDYKKVEGRLSDVKHLTHSM